MVFVTYFIILTFIEFIVYSFHLSTLILLWFKRKTSFKGSFYNIFRMVFVADIALFLIGVMSSRIVLLFIEFFNNNGFLSPILYNLTSYFAVMQFLGHLLMAFNRFTLFWMSLKHEWIWRCKWYIYVLIVLPFFNVCYRLHLPGAFIITVDNNVILSFTDKNLLAFAFLMSTVIYITTTCIAAVLNFLSFIKFYWTKQSGNLIHGNEKGLFFITCLIFLAQIFRLAYNLGRSQFTDQTMIALLSAIFPLVSDIFAWTGSISLFLLSRTTRKEYIKFYMCKKTIKTNSNSNITIFNKH